MNQEFLYIVIIIALGYLLKRTGILKETDGEVISRIIFNITLPSLVIVSLQTSTITVSLLGITLIVILYGILSTIVAYFVFRNETREIKGTFMMLASGYNVGLFAFPLVEAFWGTEGLLYFGMFDVGNSFIVFGLAYIVGSYFSENGMKLEGRAILMKFGKSIPLMTYIVMSVLNFGHIQLPSALLEVATIISKANMPLALLLLGIYLKFSFEKQYIRPIIKYLSFRYGFALLVGISLYFVLPVDDMFKYTILLGLVLPIGLAVIPYAHEFKYRTTMMIGTVSNLCILISMILMYLFSLFIL
ncbi:AEC family transporter [Bacillus sp. FJAT-27986]|uniref:AEC family transporter n=1 Tax=Bacillus sp. FJAT-27986 TaxID=1743146 RepID=UPI00080AE756|nr:AEC family transporter [Bacillus sp. FJAT-27986]OCA89236.1 malonate transporter [Bacillus sp. FJAT-27986]